SKRKQEVGQALSETDRSTLELVLGEMLQSILVLERFCYVAGKMGLFSFDLKKVLVDYVDDVQVVAEFKKEGQDIGKLFSDRLQSVHQQFREAEIHLVTHSEGTVVALLGLLSALCDPQEGPSWVDKVRGLMTFGSPIDKHLILWPELFETFKTPCRTLAEPIEWHNYYDYGDPIGFELDTAGKRFADGPWTKIFNFGLTPPKTESG